MLPSNASITPRILLLFTDIRSPGFSKLFRNKSNYLNDLGFLISVGGLGNIEKAQIFYVRRLLPNGINIVEDQPEFKRTFGFEVNLGLIKFSWGTTER